MVATAWNEVIRDRLIELGQGQRWLGERVARIERRKAPYSQQNVSAWIAGDRVPDPSTLFVIEKVLELEPGALTAPLGFVPAGTGAGVERAILDDGRLTASRKRALLAVYRELRK